MRSEIAEVGVEAKVFGLLPASGAAQIRLLRTSERLRNMLPKLGIFWGIALFCVLLPLIHFVLVPLFLCLGIYFSAKTAAVRGLIVSGSVPCPGCKKPNVLKPRPAQWPIAEVCTNCRRDLELYPVLKSHG
ncbi:MAG: hypothetical protein ACHQ51_05125 [Elusimicrobiota bacterium]